jgi:hypothetical protein
MQAAAAAAAVRSAWHGRACWTSTPSSVCTSLLLHQGSKVQAAAHHRKHPKQAMDPVRDCCAHNACHPPLFMLHLPVLTNTSRSSAHAQLQRSA